MLSGKNMDKAELKTAIRKLRHNHQIGHEIRELLELGPSGKQARDGEMKNAAIRVGWEWGRKIEYERARKLVEFSKKYSAKHLERLVEQCKKSGYAPEFGVIIRLLPLPLGERNKLQKKVIEGQWKKARLNQEIARGKPAALLIDSKRRGRRPAAIASVENLNGELLADAIKWGRILDFLQQDGNTTWKDLSRAQKEDLDRLGKLLLKLSKIRTGAKENI